MNNSVVRSRVSFEQREKLLEFMLAHEDLARGRVSGPEAAMKKKELLEDLTLRLNALNSGGTKTADKWMKCWQDWKSDTKAKALRIKKYNEQKTDCGPCPAPLTKLEEVLLEFCGIDLGSDDAEQLQTAAMDSTTFTLDPNSQEAIYFETPLVIDEPEMSEGTCNRTKDDPLLVTLDRQAIAIESLAGAMQDMSAALREVASAINQQPRILLSGED